MIGPKGKELMTKLLSPLRFKFFGYKHLPSVAFWKIRILAISPSKCDVHLPFNRRNKNPFNSTYFAAMMGAGELSTGTLCMIHLADRGKWSMLVTNVKSEFYKKTSESIVFSCNQGSELKSLLDAIEENGKPAKLEMMSEGKNTSGIVVVRIWVTWSFKKKS